jgi:MoxR-like ATPase
MSERKVSVERQRYTLPEPFTVLATQNPLEYQGTFPLPESQLDRFLMSLFIGYPPRADERELLLSGGVEEILETLEPVLSRDELLDLQERVRRVHVADKLADYMLSLAEVTRRGGDFLLGVSTRGVQSLYRAVQAMALCEGRGYAIPDDVQRLAAPVLAHRVVLKRGTSDLDSARKAVERVVGATPVPV